MIRLLGGLGVSLGHHLSRLLVLLIQTRHNERPGKSVLEVVLIRNLLGCIHVLHFVDELIGLESV